MEPQIGEVDRRQRRNGCVQTLYTVVIPSHDPNGFGRIGFSEFNAPIGAVVDAKQGSVHAFIDGEDLGWLTFNRHLGGIVQRVSNRDNQTRPHDESGADLGRGAASRGVDPHEPQDGHTRCGHRTRAGTAYDEKGDQKQIRASYCWVP
jgi:hypothetical protein